MARKYKVLVQLNDGQEKYLGEHYFNGDPWQELGRVVKQSVKIEDPEQVISQRGYREDMPFYSEIVDVKTFNMITLEHD